MTTEHDEIITRLRTAIMRYIIQLEDPFSLYSTSERIPDISRGLLNMTESYIILVRIEKILEDEE